MNLITGRVEARKKDEKELSHGYKKQSSIINPNDLEKIMKQRLSQVLKRVLMEKVLKRVLMERLGP